MSTGIKRSRFVIEYKTGYQNQPPIILLQKGMKHNVCETVRQISNIRMSYFFILYSEGHVALYQLGDVYLILWFTDPPSSN